MFRDLRKIEKLMTSTLASGRNKHNQEMLELLNKKRSGLLLPVYVRNETSIEEGPTIEGIN
jgi:hypothetical protein